MEEINEILLKHVCKFCGKSFSGGRSLGGHMRSHMIDDVSALSDGTKLTRKKLPPLPATTATITTTTATTKQNKKSKKTSFHEMTTYELRENPKKTWRVETETEDHNKSSIDHETAELFDKVCKECGKPFPTWKALFGHMKFHSLEKERVFNCNEQSDFKDEDDEEQDSLTSSTGNKNRKQLILDSQSDNEIGACNKRKRSQRRRTRRTVNNASSFSFADTTTTTTSINNNNVSSCVSEFEKELEEVAISLMLLSHDCGNWVGVSNSGSSDTDSNVMGTRVDNSAWQEVKTNMNKTEYPVSGVSRNLTSKAGSDQITCNSSKRKLSDSSFHNQELQSDSTEKPPAMDTSVDLVKNGKKTDKSVTKFACTACNRVFHSYQALGGHRASHKKTKSCSKVDSGTESTSTETEEGNKFMLLSTNNVKGHECSICLKVFNSGQALGGHKRAHSIEANTDSKEESAIRDFLDLNLPAPTEEEASTINTNNFGFSSWWIDGSTGQKPEPVFRLISS